MLLRELISNMKVSLLQLSHGTIFLCVVGCLLVSAHAVTVEQCGIRSVARIVGGSSADHGKYPWLVSLHEKTGRKFEHVCGASVLNENWIITAAHCIDYVTEPSFYRIFVGLHKQSKAKAATVQKIKISKIILHEDYNDDTSENDIALLKTATPIDIAGSGGYVNGICLPTSNRDPTGYAKVIGWGHTYEDGENSDILKEARVPIIPRDICNEAYDEDPNDEIDEIKETMLCAGMGIRDSCQNDSGGPLFQTNKNGVATLIGVVSHGSGCGDENYPGVYTKVFPYVNWIQNTVTKESGD